MTEKKFIEVERQESFIERCDPHADVSLQEVKDKENYLREFSQITSKQQQAMKYTQIRAIYGVKKLLKAKRKSSYVGYESNHNDRMPQIIKQINNKL